MSNSSIKTAVELVLDIAKTALVFNKYTQQLKDLQDECFSPPSALSHKETESRLKELQENCKKEVELLNQKQSWT